MRFLLTVVYLMFFASPVLMAKDFAYDRAAAKICRPVCKKAAKKHHIDWIGQGGAFRGSVNNVRHTFLVLRPLTKEEGREIIVDCTDEILKAINSNEEIRPYLICYPFSLSNVTVSLLISNPDRSDVYDPFPTAIRSQGGKIYYCYHSPGTWRRFTYDRDEEEAYEEALRIVRGEAGQEKTVENDSR